MEILQYAETGLLQAESLQDLWGAASNTGGWLGAWGWWCGGGVGEGRLFVVLKVGRQYWFTAGVTVNMRQSTSLGKLEREFALNGLFGFVCFMSVQ